jgi:hypothetical protein
MKKVNSKIAIQPRHLTFCLGICLDLLPRPSCLIQDVTTKIQDVTTKIQDVITKIQDVMAPSQRRHGPSQWALTSPVIWPYLLHKTKLPKSKGTGGFVRH